MLIEINCSLNTLKQIKIVASTRSNSFHQQEYTEVVWFISLHGTKKCCASQFLTTFLSWLFEFQCCPNLLQENFLRNIKQIYHIRVHPRNNSVKITEKKQFSQVPYWRKPLMWMQLFQNKTSKFQWTLDDIKIEKKFEKITKNLILDPILWPVWPKFAPPGFFCRILPLLVVRHCYKLSSYAI